MIVEHRDSIAHLRAQGFGPLLAKLEDPRMYTAGGKLVLAKLARSLRISTDRCAARLAEARELLGGNI